MATTTVTVALSTGSEVGELGRIAPFTIITYDEGGILDVDGSFDVGDVVDATDLVEDDRLDTYEAAGRIAEAAIEVLQGAAADKFGAIAWRQPTNEERWGTEHHLFVVGEVLDA